METQQDHGPKLTANTLPSARRLLLSAVLLPAIVAGANQLFINTLSSDTLRTWFFPSLILSTAALSWCAGRYLHPVWFRLILFAWCLAFLDALVAIACLTGRVEDQFGYVLVSAQISLLVLWAVLGAQPWQWRLPVIAALIPLVVAFSGSFTRTGANIDRNWNVMMFITASIVALLCGGLRYFGFKLQDLSHGSGDGTLGKAPTYQFGMKHMLIWFSVSGPLLLLVRSLDWKGTTVFPMALLSASVATVSLLAIWAVLGSGYWLIRIVALIALPSLIAYGMWHYAAYIKSTATTPWYSNYGNIAWSIGEMQDHWFAWLWIDTALLAALLIFFRASGYRLMRMHG